MKEEIKFKDCVVGEIYHCSDGYIMRHDPYKANNISIKGSGNYYHGTGCFNGSGYKLRIATQEERDWFIACEKAGKFIPQEDVKPEIINDYQIY